MKQAVRIKLLSLLFVITGLGAAFVLFRNTSFGSNDSIASSISLDSASLKKVTLKHENQTTVLTREPKKWMVNGKYKTRQNPIQLMVLGLSKAEIKRPVAEENKKKAADLLKQKGIFVTAEGDSWKKSFYIAPNDNDANSSYYMQEGSQEVYVVYVPGFTGDMSNIFKMKESDWRSRELFTSTPISLEQITVNYPAFKERNIDIKWNSNKTFEIKGIKNIDSTKVVTYLSQFEMVNVDNYIYKDKEAIMTSLRKKEPQAIITVKDLNTTGSHTLSLYSESKEPAGIYAIVEPENELVTMKQETLFRILVRKEFFEKKNK